MRIQKINFIFTSLVLFISFCTIAPTQNPPSGNQTFIHSPTVTNNSASPTFNNQPIYNTEINPQFITNTTSHINAIGSQIRDLTLFIAEKAQETFNKKNYAHAKNYLQQLFWEYRYKIAVGTLCATYTTTALLLAHDYYYLKEIHRWNNWKSDCTFEQLCEIPHTELAQELVRTIGQYHYNKKNPADPAHPFIEFITTIETEIKTCKRYVALAKIIKRLHLTPIFPTNDTKIGQVNSFLERCLFIKHIFLSWLAERNLITKQKKALIFRAPFLLQQSITRDTKQH